MSKNFLRRITALSLSAAMVFGLLPGSLTRAVPIAPVEAMADDYSNLTGNGDEASPYQINNEDDLFKFRDEVNSGINFEGKVVKLMTNVEVKKPWDLPIGLYRSYYSENEQNAGFRVKSFKGTFDGGGNTISGLNQNATFAYEPKTESTSEATTELSPEQQQTIWKQTNRAGGLFAYTSGATIKNLKVSGSISINADSGDVKNYFPIAGGIVGEAKNSKIENCSFKGSVTANGGHVGGIVGGSIDTDITLCRNEGTLNVIAVSVVPSGNFVGGIAGTAAKPEGKHAIKNCYNSGAITTDVAQYSSCAYAGGIVGYNYDNDIISCYNTGIINETSKVSEGDKLARVGAIAGSSTLSTNGADTKNNCYTTNGSFRGVGSNTGENSKNLSPVEATEDKLSSGEIAWTLQNSNTEKVWGQLDGNPVLRASSQGDVKDVYRLRFLATNDRGEETVFLTKFAIEGSPDVAKPNDEEMQNLPKPKYKRFDHWTSDKEKLDENAFAGDTYNLAKDADLYAVYARILTDPKEYDDVVSVTYGQEAEADIMAHLALSSGTEINAEDFNIVLKEEKLPKGMSYSPETKKITGTPTEYGEFPLTFTVTDNKPYSTISLDPKYPTVTGELKITLSVVFPGSGTSIDPYQIGNADALAYLSTLVEKGNDYKGKFFKMTENIDLSTVCSAELGSFKPIGSEGKEFAGTFDGDGKYIRDIYIKAEDIPRQGLFGVNSGTIKNLVITTGTIDASHDNTEYTGGIVAENKGRIEGCVNNIPVKGDGNVGGIAGLSARGAVIVNSYSMAAVTNSGLGEKGHTGGIAGTNNGSIDSCYNRGIVSCENENSDLCGIMGAGTGTAKNCYYLNGTTHTSTDHKHTGTDIVGKELKDFESGEVGYLLNKGSSSGAIWHQNLDSDPKDEYPNLTGTGPIYKIDYKTNPLASGVLFSTYTNGKATKPETTPSYDYGDFSHWCRWQSRTVDVFASGEYNITGDTILYPVFNRQFTEDIQDITITHNTDVNINLKSTLKFKDSSGNDIDARNESFTFSVSSGNLPTGLSLSQNGVLTGKTTDSATYAKETPVTIKLVDNSPFVTIASTTSKEAEATINIIIEPRDMTNLDCVEPIDKQVYTGEAITPKPVVKCGDVVLDEIRDYTLSYDNNTNVGTATVTIDFTGTNHSGQKKVNFEIVKADTTVAPADGTVTYGETLTLTADVKKAPITAIALTAAKDAVSFYAGTELLGSANVVYTDAPKNTEGTATLTVTADKKLSPGANVITAVYGGSVNLNGSQGNNTSLKLEPKTITYSITDFEKTYDGKTEVSHNFTPVGVLEGDEVTVTVKGNTDSANASSDPYNVTFYESTVGGKDAGYYTLSSDSLSAKVTIKPMDVSAAVIEPIPDQIYKTGGNTPDITVTYEDIHFVKDRDYTVKYENNIEATEGTGTKAKATVEFKGNYTGTTEPAEFEILKADTAIEAGEAEAVYGETLDLRVNVGAAEAAKISVTSDDTVSFYLGEKLLGTANVEYETEQKDKGSAGISITVKKADGFVIGNNTVRVVFEGGSNLEAQNSEISVNILPKELHYTVEPSLTKTYDGKTEIRAEGTPTDLVPGDSVQIMAIGDTDSPNVQTEPYNVTFYEAELTGTDKDYYKVAGTPTANVTIEPLDASTAEAEIAPQTYTGSEITPDVSLSFGDIELVKERDYDVSYSNNINAGTEAEATVNFKGNFTGSKTVKFEISKADSNVTAEDGSAEYGQSLTLTAKVVKAPSLIEAIALTAALDTVEFYVGETSIGKAVVEYKDKDKADEGTATLVYDTTDKILPAGQSVVKAVYGGSVNLNGSEGSETTVTITPKALSYTIPETIEKDYDGSAAIELELAPDDALAGDNVKVTAKATAPSSNAGEYENVEFYEITLTGDDAQYYTPASEVQSAKVTINPANADSAELTPIPTQVYTGSAIEPQLTIKLGELSLVKDMDYDVIFKDNTNAGTASVTINFKGNYTGTKETTFVISKANSVTALTVPESVVYGETFTATANVRKAETTNIMAIALGFDVVEISAGDKVIGSGVVTYNPDGISGTATIEISTASRDLLIGENTLTAAYGGTANLNESFSAEAKITLEKKPLPYDVTVHTKEYDGSAEMPADFTPAAGATVGDDKPNISGKAAVSSADADFYETVNLSEVTVDDGYYTVEGSKVLQLEAPVEIYAKDSGKLTVSPIDDQTYTGSDITPSVTVTDDALGKTLAENTDYTVSYSDNLNAGQASAQLTFTGNYAGTRTVSFNIVKAPSTVTATGNTTVVYGDNLEITVGVTGAAVMGDYVTVIINGNSYSSIGSEQTLLLNTYDKMLNIGENTIEIVYSGNDNVESSSATLNVTMERRPITFTTKSEGRTYDGTKGVSVTLTPTNTDDDNITLTASGSLSSANAGKYSAVDLTDIVIGGTYADYYTTTGSAGNAALESPIEITPKDSGSLTIEDIPVYRYTGSQIRPKAEVSDGEVALTEGIDYELSYGENLMTEGTVTITFKGNYSGEREVSFEIIKGIPNEIIFPTAEDITYGMSLSDSALNGGNTNGTFAWADGSIKPEAGVHSYDVVFTPDDTDFYDYSETTLVKAVSINVAQAKPIQSEAPTAGSIHSGQTLGSATIDGGSFLDLEGNILAGTYSFKDGDKKMTTGTHDEVIIFTPENTNYAPVEITVTVVVNSSSSSSGGSTGGGGGGGGGKAPTKTTESASEATSDKSTEANTEEKVDDNKPDENNTPDNNASSDKTENAEADNWANPFNDVESGAWYYEAVKWANTNGIMSGTEKTEFAPYVPITRAMIVAILYRAEGSPKVASLSTFEDVPEDAYYAEAVAWAEANGIVMGYSETSFVPETPITREQMAAIMSRYAKFKGVLKDTDPAEDLTEFGDNKAVSDWAKSDMEWAVSNGLISGEGNSTINPLGNTTRAAAASILYRFVEKTK